MPRQRARPREKYRARSERLMDGVREVLRPHHCAIRTRNSRQFAIARYVSQDIQRAAALDPGSESLMALDTDAF